MTLHRYKHNGYDVDDESDKQFLIDAFNDAFKLCKYEEEYYVNEVKENDEATLIKYVLSDDQNEALNVLSLVIIKDSYYMYVANSYYESFYKLNEIDDMILSFLMRNATKIIDDFESSRSFFESFFASHLVARDNEMFNAMLNIAVKESVILTKVSVVICDMQTNDICHQKAHEA